MRACAAISDANSCLGASPHEEVRVGLVRIKGTKSSNGTHALGRIGRRGPRVTRRGDGSLLELAIVRAKTATVTEFAERRSLPNDSYNHRAPRCRGAGLGGKSLHEKGAG